VGELYIKQRVSNCAAFLPSELFRCQYQGSMSDSASSAP
jgi:hypothetical protein